MARPKRDESEAIPKKQKLALQFSSFREANGLSQTLLAEIIGVSRRTIQSVEAANILPQEGTLEKFEKLRDKYRKEGKPVGKISK